MLTSEIKECIPPPTLDDCNIETLFVRGAMPNKNRPHLAVVGTRRCTPEGERITKTLIEPLARAGVVIVSGLAEGIDTVAHKAALASNGTTIAVLGTGIDNESIYPQRNVALANNIIETGGAVISEYSLGTPGRKHHFPQRNRIIAGLSTVTLVIEAPEKSGALITAKHAKRLGRIIATVPGSLSIPQYKGNNHLLEQEAFAITSPERLAELFNINLEREQKLYTPQSSEERELLSLLHEGPQGIDTILNRCTMPTSSALGILADLEQEEIIEEINAKRYQLKAKIT